MARYGIDHETGYSLCKHGHVLSPDNTTTDRRCKICLKSYRHRNEYKTAQKTYGKAYRSKEKNKDRKNALAKTYRTTEKHKAWRSSYDQCAKRKAYQKEYNKSCRNNLEDGYISSTLHIRVTLATPELIEIKRLTLQLQRSLKNVNKIGNHNNDNRECTGSAGGCVAASI